MFKTILALIGSIIFSLWLLKYTSPNLRIEGYSGMIWECLVPSEDTEYAPGYSHKRFLWIKEGMTEKEVISILGEPLVRWQPKEGYVGFQYTNSPSSTHYRLRQVYLSEGIVKEVIGYFYLD